MSFVSKSLVVLLSALTFANVLATPHAVHGNAHIHRAIAARVAAASPGLSVPSPLAVPKLRDLRKRSLNKRCKTRSAPSSSFVSSSAAPTSSASSSVFSSSSIEVPTTSDTPAETPTPAPTPTSTPEPAPTSTSEAAPATSSQSSSSGSSSGGFMSGTNSGDGTFYATGLGACGITNSDTDYICAVSLLLFDAFPGYDGVNPNKNPVCGKQIVASRGGKSVTVTVTDRCEGCAQGSLDFSPSAFDILGSEGEGRIPITWTWA